MNKILGTLTVRMRMTVTVPDGLGVGNMRDRVKSVTLDIYHGVTEDDAEKIVQQWMTANGRNYIYGHWTVVRHF